jgi:hypothetical protein
MRGRAIDTSVPLEARFWQNVTRGSNEECWEWRGRISNQYGAIALSGNRVIRAHRVAYELLVGPIPDGYIVHHTCRNTLCVNPGHLQAMTQADHGRAHKGDLTILQRRAAA